MIRLEHRRLGAAALLVLAAGFWLTLIGHPGFAQQLPQQQPTNHIRNHGNPELYLDNPNGQPAADTITPGAPSAQWSLEPVPGEILMLIRNAQTGGYLNTENGVLAVGDVAPGQVSAEWQVEPVEGTAFVRFRNASTGLYLGLQDVAGPLAMVSLDPAAANGAPAAPPPGVANATTPAIAEWEFVVASGIPLIAAPTVTIPKIVPTLPPGFVEHIRSCGGGRIYYRGACRCPVEAIDEGGYCRLPHFSCRGGRIIELQCVCPGYRVPIATGPRELTCVYAGGPPPCPPDTIRTIFNGRMSCTSTRCPRDQFFSLNQMRCIPIPVRCPPDQIVRGGICVPRNLICLGGRVVGGRCACGGGSQLACRGPNDCACVAAPPPACPPGQVGTPPNCHAAVAPTCPPGQVGTPPNCHAAVAPTCPPGQVGTPPNCHPAVAPTCPPGQVGTPPNCHPAAARTCPPGQVGTPPNCHAAVAPTCPPGQIGTPPNCRPAPRAACPPGEIGTPPNCKPAPRAACPPGEIGTPPNCRPAAPRPVVCTGGKVNDGHGACVCPPAKPKFIGGECRA